MALPNSYLTSIKHLKIFLMTIITAEAPKKFTQKFLLDLGFKSTSDRLFIPMLKHLGFLDDAGIPTTQYFQYLDQTQSGKILAQSIRNSYVDIFQLNKKANEMSVDDVKNKFKTILEGAKNEKILKLMATTFVELCNNADWNAEPLPRKDLTKDEGEGKEEGEGKDEVEEPLGSNLMQLHYNIQIHLPETRDHEVYDAIFRSLKKHILRNIK